MPELAATMLAALALAAAAPAAKPAVDRVPLTMTSAGFRITSCCSFRPVAATNGVIARQRALAIARKYAGANWRQPALLLARLVGPVTVGIGTSRIHTLHDPTTWIATFEARRPVRLGMPPGGRGPLLRHFSVALDARTGDFIRGFYTL
jgi:hypothetical protein